jgi:hypothetical protein
MGIPEFIFKNDVPSYLRCSLCNQVADLPVQCPTCLNDLYCKTCFLEYVRSQQNTSCPAASCQKHWKIEQIKINNKFYSIVNQLPARCAVEECTETGTLLHTMIHFETCPYKVVKCSNADKGCISLMPLREIEEHLRDMCEYRQILCECGEQISKKDIEVMKFITLFLHYRHTKQQFVGRPKYNVL